MTLIALHFSCPFFLLLPTYNHPHRPPAKWPHSGSPKKGKKWPLSSERLTNAKGAIWNFLSFKNLSCFSPKNLIYNYHIVDKNRYNVRIYVYIYMKYVNSEVYKIHQNQIILISPSRICQGKNKIGHIGRGAPIHQALVFLERWESWRFWWCHWGLPFISTPWTHSANGPWKKSLNGLFSLLNM